MVEFIDKNDAPVIVSAPSSDIVAYQWQVAETSNGEIIWTDIPDATELNYKVDEASAGKKIRVQITRLSAAPVVEEMPPSGAYSAAVSSDAASIGLVSAGYSAAPTGGGTLAKLGEVLVVDAGYLADAGDSSLSIAYPAQQSAPAAPAAIEQDAPAPPSEDAPPDATPDAAQVVGNARDVEGMPELVAPDHVANDDTAPINPANYKVLHASTEPLIGSSESELILGDDGDNVINTGGGDDVVIGGRGDDIITLGAGEETIIYRYRSLPNGDIEWVDGNDKIYGFERGNDRFVLVDLSAEPVKLDALIKAATGFNFIDDAIGAAIAVSDGAASGEARYQVIAQFNNDGAIQTSATEMPIEFGEVLAMAWMVTQMMSASESRADGGAVGDTADGAPTTDGVATTEGVEYALADIGEASVDLFPLNDVGPDIL